MSNDRIVEAIAGVVRTGLARDDESGRRALDWLLARINELKFDLAVAKDMCTDGAEHLWSAGQEGGPYGHSYGPRCIKCGRGPIAGIAV